jgi:predicted nuclease of predicted toxin-antitoxin system
MRLLCEGHIPTRYRQALASEDWTTVRETTEFLAPDAADVRIARFAARSDWVVLTRDLDFFRLVEDHGCGVVYLAMTRTPTPAALVAALRSIDAAYDDHSRVAESVPGGWG